MRRAVHVLLSLLCAVVGCGGATGGSADGGGASDANRGDATKRMDARPPTEAGRADGSTASPLTLVTEPDQGLSPIYALIGSAKHTIDATLYELTDTKVTSLFTTAAKNGVTVRVILDQNDEMMANTPAYNALLAGHVQVHWANPVYEATHQKTFTVDGATSAIMTLNLTPEFYATSRDFAVIDTDPVDVAAIETTFAADLVNAAIDPPTGHDLVWSPTNAQTSLLGLINGAKASLLIENEEMSDDSVVSALSAAASRGVDVEVVMEASKSYDTEFSALVAAGVKLNLYQDAAIYIHAKVILADYGESAASVFIGSENFSDASLTRNRELGIITSDPAIMASIHVTLSKDFSGATPYTGPPDGGFDGGFDGGLDGGVEGSVHEGGGG